MIVAKPVVRSPIRRAALAVAAVLAAGVIVAFAWPSPDPKRLWKEAEAACEAQRFDEAGSILARLGKLRTPTPADWMLRAVVAMASTRTDEALGDLAKIADGDRLASQARLKAGQLELRRNRFLPAEAYFKKALELDPREVQARRELVYIYGMQLRRAELNATFRALAEEGPLTYPQIFLWCLARGVTWEASEIVANLDRCLKADPTDRYARLGMAEGLRELSRFDDAEDVLAPLPESDADARSARVRLALARGDDDAAESLLAGGPADHLGLALLRGQLALVRNNAPEALRQYRLAHSLAPHQREAVFGLGQSLQLSGDATAAAPYLAESRKLDRLATLVGKASNEANRDDSGLIRDLGAACADLGRIPEARAWYELAVSRDVSDTQAQLALTRLGTGKDAAPR